MIVSISQPAYLPWLGYFHRIAESDLHIVLDHVEIDQNSRTKFANRNKIRTPDGWSWLTVPLLTKGRRQNLELHNLEIDNSTNWATKHWKAICHNYAKTPHFKESSHFFENVYSSNWRLLNNLNEHVTKYLLDTLCIKTPTKFSSRMGIESKKSELIVDLCRSVGATKYLSGPFGRQYLSEPDFLKHGVELIYHDYKHPTYSQVFENFESFMSIIDLIFSHGSESKNILSI